MSSSYAVFCLKKKTANAQLLKPEWSVIIRRHLSIGITLKHVRQPQTSTLFPYTTLFRSRLVDRQPRVAGRQHGHVPPLPGGVVAERRPRLGPFVGRPDRVGRDEARSEEHTSELQSHVKLVCRLLLEKKNR